MILGGHVIVYTTDAEADRAFMRDVLKLPNVDVGGGWLIFGLPGAEAAFHPDSENGAHELWLMTDDVKGEIARLAEHGVACEAIDEQPYGLCTRLTLPGGGKLGLYQPTHALAIGLK